MQRLAAPLFILFLTALAFAQAPVPPPEPEAPKTAETAEPSAPEEMIPPVEPATPTLKTPEEPAKPPQPAESGAPQEPAKLTEPTKKVAPPAPREAAEAEATEPTDALEIIIIAADSLNQPWGDQSKMDALKLAIRSIIRNVPKNVDVGLRVSGHRIASSDVDRSCQDSELLIAPKPQGQSILLAQLDGIQAQGTHSLVQTLSRSLADLNDYKGNKHILLITDGVEACVEQEPAAYLAADSLGHRGYRIHISGIGLSEDQSAGLAALAKTTGGSFSNAQDVQRLQEQLNQALALAGGAAPPAPPTRRAEAPSEAATPAVEQGQPAKAAPAPPKSQPIPITPPPSGVKPEPKEPPFVGPAPLPFNPTEFMKSLIGEIKKIIPKPPKPAPPPPPPPTPTFSAISLTIIIIEAVLLALALVGIALLALKEYRQ